VKGDGALQEMCSLLRFNLEAGKDFTKRTSTGHPSEAETMVGIA
jgi:hypothetical protein